MSLRRPLSPFKKRLLLSASALLLLMLGVFLYTWIRPGEPRYAGKPISYWLQQYQQNLHLEGARTLEASNAIFHIGPAAIPFALDRLRIQTDQWNRAPRSTWNIRKQRAEWQGFLVFSILGERGAAATPELRQMLLDTNNNYLVPFALAHLGEDGLSTLAEGRTNNATAVRLPALLGLLRVLRQSNQQLHLAAVQTILQTNGDPDPNYTIDAFLANLVYCSNVNFAYIGTNLPVVPTLLSNLLTNSRTSPSSRQISSNLLQKMHRSTMDSQRSTPNPSPAAE